MLRQALCQTIDFRSVEALHIAGDLKGEIYISR